MKVASSDPGTPDHRSASRYLWWLVTSQRRRIAAGALFGSAWMLCLALLADPEVLLAVEPASALDAHTEAAVATGLRTARSGRTTVVTSTSPLMLDQADTVHYLVDGAVAAVGTHRELLDRRPDYRHLVSRGTGDEGPGRTNAETTGRTPPRQEAAR